MTPGTAALYGLVAFGATVIVTPLVRWLALRSGTVDDPASSTDRKLHPRPTALLGGVALVVGLAVAVLLGAHDASRPFAVYPTVKGVAVIAGLALVLLGGVLDDRRNLPARVQILFPLFAALTVVLGGVVVEFITNPLGGVLRFEGARIALPWLQHGLPVVGAAVTFLWILATTYAAKLLDGLDGLVTGIGAIGALTLFVLSVRPPVNQPETALLAAALAGACLGFLPWNWNPAKIFLGESGALTIGFTLGVLSVISGGKIATALLILGLPMLDVLWVILRRTVSERRSPFTTADQKHLHHRLLALGLSQRGAVGLLYAITATFGLLAVLTAGSAKLFALLVLVGVMLLLVAVFTIRRRE